MKDTLEAAMVEIARLRAALREAREALRWRMGCSEVVDLIDTALEEKS